MRRVIAVALVLAGGCRTGESPGGVPQPVSSVVEDDAAAPIGAAGSPDLGAPVAPGLPACHQLMASSRDGGAASCAAGGRTFLACTEPGGVQRWCFSSNATDCPDRPPLREVGPFVCQDLCADDEYGVSCPAAGMGAVQAADDRCRRVLAAPGGLLYYCCPCGR